MAVSVADGPTTTSVTGNPHLGRCSRPHEYWCRLQVRGGVPENRLDIEVKNLDHAGIDLVRAGIDTNKAWTIVARVTARSTSS